MLIRNPQNDNQNLHHHEYAPNTESFDTYKALDRVTENSFRD